MKLKNLLSLLLALVLLCSVLTGCGGSSKNSAPEEYAMEAPAAMDSAASNSLTSTGTSGSSAIPENRKWIITVTMSAETDNLDTLTAALDETITQLNGYVEDQRIYNGSTYSNHRYRSAYMTVRIPAEDVDKFTLEVSGIANVVSQEKDLEDITLNYVATESRLTALETEEARLLELLAKAENMSDLLEIEARLTEVRYELENAASRLRLYDNQVDYATIHLDITEVQEYTPVEEPTLWERISGGFTDSLKGVGEGALDLLVWIITASPYLVVYGVILTGILLLIRRARNKKIKPAPKKEDETK